MDEIVYETGPCFFCERAVVIDGTEYRLDYEFPQGRYQPLICEQCRTYAWYAVWPAGHPHPHGRKT